MSTFDLVATLKSARLQLIVNALDGGALPGELWLYTGSRPGVPGGSTTEAIQCVITLARPSGTVTANVLNFVGNLEGLRVASATIAWGRFVDGAGAVRADFDVSVAAGSGALRLNVVTGVSGSVVRLVSGTLTE